MTEERRDDEELTQERAVEKQKQARKVEKALIAFLRAGRGTVRKRLIELREVVNELDDFLDEEDDDDVLG